MKKPSEMNADEFEQYYNTTREQGLWGDMPRNDILAYASMDIEPEVAMRYHEAGICASDGVDTELMKDPDMTGRYRIASPIRFDNLLLSVAIQHAILKAISEVGVADRLEVYERAREIDPRVYLLDVNECISSLVRAHTLTEVAR